MESPNQLIDIRNSALWESLNSTHLITLQPSANHEYGCYTEGNTAIVYVDFGNICKDSFTHELLHILLKQKQFYLSASLQLTMNGSKILKRILSPELYEHIGNCLEHVKMFDIYVDLGFEPQKFLYDFDDYKCKEDELSQIRKYYKPHNRLNVNSVDFYIGKLVAMLCDPNENHDYSKPLRIFKSLDNNLYKAVEELIDDTKRYNLDTEDVLVSYRDISNAFYSKVVQWIKVNKVT